ALNVAEPVLAEHFGKAAFDSVGPLLLIGWAELGPGLLQTINKSKGSRAHDSWRVAMDRAVRAAVDREEDDHGEGGEGSGFSAEDGLLERARREDSQHWEEFGRPISAETLRKRRHVGAARSRMLVAIVRRNHYRAGQTSIRSREST